MEARGNYTRSCGVSKSREPNNDAQFVPGRLSFTILWGAGSLLSCEASWVTWSDVVARSVCGLEHPAGGRSSPAGAALSRVQPKHGCCGLPSEPPYFTRIAISRASFLGMELTQPRSPVSRRSLVWKLGAAALFWVSPVGPYAGSCR
jgi:hypothetical protein